MPDLPTHHTASFTTCDCHTVVALDHAPLSALSVHAASRHLHRKLALLLTALGLPLEVQDGAFVVPAHAFGALEAVLSGFSVTERPGVLAAPWQEGRLDTWHLAALDKWVGRLTSPWFAAASGCTFTSSPSWR